MSRLRKIAQIPAASWTQWVVVGFWVLMLVIEGIKVQAVRTARLGSADRLRGDRDQRQSRQHTWWAGNAPARTAAT
jgi:hypothetical protein